MNLIDYNQETNSGAEKHTYTCTVNGSHFESTDIAHVPCAFCVSCHSDDTVCRLCRVAFVRAAKMSESSTAAFERLAEAAANDSRTYRARRTCVGILLVCVGLVTVAALFGEASTSFARRYARAHRDERAYLETCDASLGKKKYGFASPVVVDAMCATHTNRSMLKNDDADLLRFFVIGDWGRNGMCCQRDVAAEMENVAAHWNPSFVVAVGDNFYHRGIEKFDAEQVDDSWRQVYLHPYPTMSKLVWKSIPGNHDHLGNIHAQIELARKEKRWHMPATHYFEQLAGGRILFAFLDTTPMYYTRSQLTVFRGNVTKRAAITEQINALEKQLKASKATWNIVFGHHPLFSSGDHVIGEAINHKMMRDRLLKLFADNRVAAYFCGHEHTLEHSVSNNVHFFVSGAGSKISPIFDHIPENVFSAGRQGFMAVSIQASSLNVKAVDMTGAVLHSATISPPA